MSQFYGEAGKLPSPITIGGVEYTHFVRFNSEPEGVPDEDTLVLSSRFTSWRREGDYVVGVVERQPVVGAILNAENQEIEQKYFTGNTLGAAIEPQRFYAKQSPEQSIRGGKRCGQVGDVVRFPGVSDFHRAAFPATGIEPYAESAEPRWQMGEPPRARYWLVPSMNPDSILSTSSTERVRFAKEGAAADAGGYIFRLSTGEYEPSERVIFGGDSEYYPPDATFPGTGSLGEYWYDERLTGMIFASQNEDLADVLPDEWRLVWYVERPEITETSARIIVQAGAAGSGYGPPDSLSTLSSYHDGNVTRRIRIYRLADGSWPVFTFDVRTSLEASGTGRWWVESTGTHLGGVPFLPIALSGSDDWFELVYERSGTALRFKYKFEGGSDTTVIDETTAAEFNYLSVGVWDENEVAFEFQSPTAGTEWFPFAIGHVPQAVIWERQSRDVAGVAYTETMDLQDSEAVEQVYNVTADVEMTSSATPARDHYTISSGQITFYAESDRDEIRITHEAGPVGDPDEVGIAPVQFFPSTKNMATAASSVAGENRAYWQDRVRFPDPLGLFNGPQDAEFELHREGCWDHSNPPSLAYSYKGNSSSAWTSVGSAALPLPGPKVFLLAGSWVDGLSVPLTKMCWQMRGKRVLAQASLNGDRQINVLTSALGSLVDCWIRVDLSGGGGFGVNLNAALYVGGSEFECHDGTCWRETAFAWGNAPNAMPSTAQWPYLDSGTIRYRTAEYTVDNTVVTCGAANRVLGDAIQDGLAVLNVEFNNPFAYNLFGSAPGPYPETPQSFLPSAFFSTVSVGIPKVLRKFPIEILEAYGIVDFSNLTSNYGTFDPTGGTSASGIGGTIHWQLVGLRKLKRTIRDGSGNPTNIREWAFNTYGASISGSAAEGPTVYNALSLLEALMTARGDNAPDHVLMPSTGLTSGTSEGLKNYLLSLFPDGGLSASVDTVDGCDVTVDYSVPWRQFSYDQVSIHTILARVRVPSGLLAHRAFPLVRPALVPY